VRTASAVAVCEQLPPAAAVVGAPRGQSDAPRAEHAGCRSATPPAGLGHAGRSGQAVVAEQRVLRPCCSSAPVLRLQAAAAAPIVEGHRIARGSLDSSGPTTRPRPPPRRRGIIMMALGVEPSVEPSNQLILSLRVVVRLHSTGSLSDGEFQVAKERLLRAPPPAPPAADLAVGLSAAAEMHGRGELSAAEFQLAKGCLLPPAPLPVTSPPCSQPSASPAQPAMDTPTGGASSNNTSKRQRTGREWRDLPAPSAEQRAVMDAVAGGHCATVCSVAGSGKTTLMLQVAQELRQREPGRRAQILTYNRALKDECAERIRALGLTGTVSSSTIHGLIARSAARSCKNDTEMLEITEEWDRGVAVASPMDCDVVLLDEVQDLRPSFYRAVQHLLRAAAGGQSSEGRSLQLVLVGDPKQLLYDFTSMGSDKASAQYIEQPAKYFGEFTTGRQWQQLQLSVSYRLTPSMAAFANVVWGTNIVGGSHEQNLPVEYWCRGPFPPRNQAELKEPGLLKLQPATHNADNVTTKALVELLDTYGSENVMFLAQSVKSEKSPIRQHVNLLAKLVDKRGERRFNFDIKENTRGFEGKRDLKNKTRVWTYCSAKGCEADAVVVFGVDMGDPAWITTVNQIGVGLSRACKKLVVVHTRKWDRQTRAMEPQAYFPAGSDSGLQPGSDGYVQALRERSRTTQRSFAELHERGILYARLQTDLPANVRTDDSATTSPAMDAVYAATDFTHFSAAAALHFLRCGTWVVEVQPADLPWRIDYCTEVQFEQTVEDVSALYGQALTLMLQFERDGFCPQVEPILEGGIVAFSLNRSYDMPALKRIFRISDCFTEHQERLCVQALASQKPPGTMKGKDVIVLVNTRLMLQRSRSLPDGSTAVYPVRAVEEGIMEQLLAPWVEELRRLYSAKEKTPAQWLYIANFQLAYQNFHDKFHQCGTNPGSYDRWVDGGALLAGLSRLRLAVPVVSPSSTPTPTAAAAAGLVSAQAPQAQAELEQGAVVAASAGGPRHSFEYEMLYEFPPGLVVERAGKSTRVVGVCGQVDWAHTSVEDRPGSEPDLMYEPISVSLVSQPLGSIGAVRPFSVVPHPPAPMLEPQEEA
jgi:hypothetical protein